MTEVHNSDIIDIDTHNVIHNLSSTHEYYDIRSHYGKYVSCKYKVDNNEYGLYLYEKDGLVKHLSIDITGKFDCVLFFVQGVPCYACRNSDRDLSVNLYCVNVDENGNVNGVLSDYVQVYDNDNNTATPRYITDIIHLGEKDEEGYDTFIFVSSGAVVFYSYLKIFNENKTNTIFIKRTEEDNTRRVFYKSQAFDKLNETGVIDYNDLTTIDTLKIYPLVTNEYNGIIVYFYHNTRTNDTGAIWTTTGGYISQCEFSEFKLGENDNIVLFSSVTKNGKDEIQNIIEKSLGTN